MKIAVYGTLRKGWGNHRLIEDAEFIGQGKTNDLHSMYASGIPYVKKDGGTSRITVEVYEVPDSDMERVDSLEGHPRWYRREETPVTLDNGEQLNAWLYFMPGVDGTNLTLIESGDYADYRKAASY